MKDVENFSYKTIEKSEYVIVTLKGDLNKGSRAALETLHKDIEHFEKKIFVLYFKDVSTIDLTNLRALSLIQQDIRKKNQRLFLAGLNKHLKQFLVEKGIIRLTEVKASLEEIVRK